MTDDIKAIRDALQAGPTPWPWFQHDTLGHAVAAVARARVCADAVPAADKISADAAYIATCHPKRIARLLDALEVAKADAARYKQVLDDALELLREDLEARTKAAAELLAALELFERGCDGPAFEDWTNGNGDLCGPAIYAAIEGMKAAMKGQA